MKESFIQYRDRLFQFWEERTSKQKIFLIASIAIVLVTLIALIKFAAKPNYEPLYSNLSVEEAGQIKESLDSRGVRSIVSDQGTTILVPKEAVNSLKVELAAEGIPKSGNIDYSFFSENASFGMTDNEFNILERDAMQTELTNLIKNIEGVNDANVMINLPGESIWVAQEEESSSASVVLNLSPSKELNDREINALHNLVSKSVPNLPVENIVIMDQYFNYFDLSEQGRDDSTYTLYEQQRKVKQEIERDLQRQVHHMLALLIGQDKVAASVTTDIDFTQENREENLVEPVDLENMEGLQVSVERIRESFTGDADAAEGVGGTGETDIPEYPGMVGGQLGDYEKDEERINNEFNRIRKDIVESPYKIQDLGIQVMVEPPDPTDPDSLGVETVAHIEEILSAIVRTTISKNADTPLDEEEIANKVYVSAQPFYGKQDVLSDPTLSVPAWLYYVGGFLIVIIIVLAILLYRKRQRDDVLSEEAFTVEEEEDIPDLDDFVDLTDERKRIAQLEKLADEKPDEFAKLLRTWLTDE